MNGIHDAGEVDDDGQLVEHGDAAPGGTTDRVIHSLRHPILVIPR